MVKAWTIVGIIIGFLIIALGLIFGLFYTMWSSSTPTLPSPMSQVEGKCIAIDLKPLSCTYNSVTYETEVSVMKEREQSLDSLKLIFYFDNEISRIVDKNVTFDNSGITSILIDKKFDTKPLRFSVAGVISVKSGEDVKTIVCPESTEKVSCLN